MKKTILLFSAIVLFAGMTFAQTPQTQDKAVPAPKAQTTTTKDTKAGCDQKAMDKCAKTKDVKSGCCAHGEKKASTDTKAPEKK